MTDPDSGLPADSLAADGTTQRPDLDHQHRRVPVEHGGRRGARDHRPRGGRRADLADPGDARRHGTPRGERPVLQLVQPPHGREAHRVAVLGRPADPDPVVGRQRLAGRGPAGRRQQRPGGRRGRLGALRQHGLRLLLPGRRQPHPVPLRAGHRRRAVLLRHDREREPDRDVHRHRQGRDPAAGVLRPVADLPGHLRLELAGDEAAGRDAHVPRHRRVRGRLPVRGLPGRARVGRLDVRGADAHPVRPRGAVGAPQLAGQPPADRDGPDPPRPRGGAVRLLGLLPLEHPRGRLPRVRCRCARPEPGRLLLQPRPHGRSTEGSPVAPTARPSPTRRRPRTRTAS